MTQLPFISSIVDRSERKARQAADLVGDFSASARASAANAAQIARRRLDHFDGVSTIAGRALKNRGRAGARAAVAGARLHPVATGAALVAVTAVGVLIASPRARAAFKKAIAWGKQEAVKHTASGSERRSFVADKPRTVRERQEDLLDQGIEESFPASDPVSVKRIT